MTNKIINIFFIYLILAFNLYASGDGGQTGAFLRRGINSKALAMGKAYTSVVNDASSIYWNPAGLSSVPNNEFMGMFSFLSFDRKDIFFSFVHNIPEIFSIGIGWYKFGVTNIDGRNMLGQKTESFEDGQNSIGISISKSFDFLSIGVTGKYLYHTLYNNTATGYSFDLGAKVKIAKIINAGIVFQDLGGVMIWDTDSKIKEYIPLTIRLGISVHPIKIPAILSAEVCQVKNQDLLFRIGGEHKFTENFGIRAGLADEDLTFGFFVYLPFESNYIELDYAAVKDVIADAYAHYITLSIEF